MTLYFIETRCFTVHDHSLFLGTIHQLRSRLDQLSAAGWMVAAAYEMASGIAVAAEGPTAYRLDRS